MITLTRFRPTEAAHRVHQGGVDETGLAVVPLGIAVALVLRNRLRVRLIEPPEVLPGVEDAREAVAAVEIAQGRYDLRAELRCRVQAGLGVRDVDLQESRGERSVVLAVAQHDRGASDDDLGVDDLAVAIEGSDMLGFLAAEDRFDKADEAVGV